MERAEPEQQLPAGGVLPGTRWLLIAFAVLTALAVNPFMRDKPKPSEDTAALEKEKQRKELAARVTEASMNVRVISARPARACRTTFASADWAIRSRATS